MTRSLRLRGADTKIYYDLGRQVAKKRGWIIDDKQLDFRGFAANPPKATGRDFLWVNPPIGKIDNTVYVMDQHLLSKWDVLMLRITHLGANPFPKQ